MLTPRENINKLIDPKGTGRLIRVWASTAKDLKFLHQKTSQNMCFIIDRLVKDEITAIHLNQEIQSKSE